MEFESCGVVSVVAFLIFLLVRHWSNGDLRQTGFLGFCAGLSGIWAIGEYLWLGLGLGVTSFLMLFLDAMAEKFNFEQEVV